MELVVLGLVLLAAIPFVLPIVSWVYALRTRRRLEAVEQRLSEQTAALTAVQAGLTALLRERAPQTPPAVAAAPPAQPAPAASPSSALPPVVPSAPVNPPAGDRPSPVPAVTSRPPIERPVEAPVAPRRESPAIPTFVAAEATPFRPLPLPPPRPAPRPPRPPDPPAPAAATPPFDWEKLVGVKLFSAIAGIALVLAAIFFLKYSLDSGWLQPPVRVAIGLMVAIALLVACELTAARQYPATANALDAAAIAILFATFFAAHALWDLIPGSVTFGLLGVVTALAVLLSIRRESLLIAVLGLLGGFATPALLSTGENQPIPLFSYLVLLNIGLAWVAYRQRWPLLTALTLVLTTVYQWGWVMKFLEASQLTLAMGIFLVFPILSVVGLMLARRGAGDDSTFERTAALGAGAPLLFAVYLSAVPGFGARPWLLFGFLLLVDAGLLAIAAARGQKVLHAAGAAATVAVMGIWLATSYAPAHLTAVLVFTAVFAALYALAPLLFDSREPVDSPAHNAVYVAPLLLGVLTALARIEPSLAEPLRLFGTLLPLVLLLAWRAVATDRGGVYFVAAFFAFATQAVWVSTHSAADGIGTAVLVFAIFALVWMLVPVLARRAGHPLQPAVGSGIVLIASLGLMLFLSTMPMTLEGQWALAVLIVILNAGLFVESASGPLPALSIAGSLGSLLVLTTWSRAVTGVGVLPSLSVVTGLGLASMAVHAWAHRLTNAGADRPVRPATFAGGLYLGLTGHLFILLIAATRGPSLPPWPWLGALSVLTLGMSAVSLATRTAALHAAGAIGAAFTIAVWTGAAGDSWGLAGILLAGAAAGYALGWIPVSRRITGEAQAAIAAAAVLFLATGTTVLASSVAAAVPFVATLTSHVVFLSILLALTWRYRWNRVAVAALVPAAWAVLVQWQIMASGGDWRELLTLAFAVYAVFTAYPLALGRRAADARDPYLSAVLANALFFFAGRAALLAGGYGWMIGALPAAQAAVMAIMLRQLLRIQTAGDRDLGRLALVGAAALALVTVAIPVQLKQHWITIGWALEGAALAWLYRRVPHRGLLFWSLGLLGAVFVRLAMNPDVLLYEPRGTLRILNWYLYAYTICAAAFLLAGWWFSKTDDVVPVLHVRASQVLPAGAVVLLFLLLNIEIADFYAIGPTVMFEFGKGLSQDLTYTIGWLVFGMALLAAGIYLHHRAARITALALVAITTFKCFLYDLGSLDGLYRVSSFVGLAMSLALISIALQKFVLARPEEHTP